MKGIWVRLEFEDAPTEERKVTELFLGNVYSTTGLENWENVADQIGPGFKNVWKALGYPDDLRTCNEVRELTLAGLDAA